MLKFNFPKNKGVNDKTALLVISPFCTPHSIFLNTLTADDEYSCSNRKNLPSPIQMQFSEKPKTLCCSFIAFLESTLNFEQIEKNEPHIAQVVLKLLTPKDVATKMHKRSCF